METQRLIDTLTKIIQSFPIGTSLITVLIICFTVYYDEIEEELSLKKLYSLLHRFSDVGIKNHVGRLHHKGLIQIKKSKNDKRVRVINGTKELHETYKKIINSD